MAVLKMLPSEHHALLSIYTKCWNIMLRSVSKSKVMEELIGCPEKPKKPVNAFIKFVTKVGHDHSAQGDFNHPSDLFKSLGSTWRDMTDKEKEEYLKEYEKETEEYREKYRTYEKSLTNTQKEKLKSLKKKIDKAIESFPCPKPELKNLNKPTHPGSPFTLYCQEFRRKQGASCKVTNANLVEEWKNLSDNEKEKYKAQYSRVYRDYKENLEKWEMKMMQEGNIEALSLKTLKELKGKI